MADIIIHIKQEEVEKAKQISLLFDQQKTHNKFVCHDNYIGFLGELVLDRYLTEKSIPHQWVDFVKDNWDQPDFIIHGNTYDLKTTRSRSLWFTKPIYDYYIGAYIPHGDRYLVLKGMVKRENMMKKALGIQRKDGTRMDNCISHKKLAPISFVRLK